MSPFLAASLSLVPGAGHWALRKRRKAAALFVFDAGIIFSLLVFKSNLTYFLACFSYFIIMIPAAMESYAFACGNVSPLTESKPYILFLLLMKGFSALPLLWQSHGFSKRVKIAWSIAVPVLAILYFGFLGIYGIRLFHYAKIHFG